MPTEDIRLAFFPHYTLAPEHISTDRYIWEHMLRDMIPLAMHIYSVTKQFLITCLLHNYKKIPMTTTMPAVGFTFKSFRRIDDLDTIVDYIKTRRLNNEIYFIAKTSISGRQIATIAATINDDPLYTFTEETATSLYLQTDNHHPVRVFKLTTNNPTTTTYFVIGSNQMLMNVYYTCLALVPKWYPQIFEGIDSQRVDALINLFTAIGHMNSAEYDTAFRHCVNLCYEPTEPELDFTTISSFLKTDISTQINSLQGLIESYQKQIAIDLKAYERHTEDLRTNQQKLTTLLTAPNTDNAAFINDAKSCKSIVAYNLENSSHVITLKSKMLIDSKAIVTKILEPNNTQAQTYYNITTLRARKLFEELWLKETLQIFFCTTFVKTTSASVPTTIRVPKRTRNTKNTMPNPHLIHYSCFGSNKKLLIDAANNNNLQYYLGALTACNSNLNTGDATVLRRFCSEVLSNYADTPILYDVETKTYTTPRERMQSYETV